MTEILVYFESVIASREFWPGVQAVAGIIVAIATSLTAYLIWRGNRLSEGPAGPLIYVDQDALREGLIRFGFRITNPMNAEMTVFKIRVSQPRGALFAAIEGKDREPTEWVRGSTQTGFFLFPRGYTEYGRTHELWVSVYVRPKSGNIIHNYKITIWILIEGLKPYVRRYTAIRRMTD